MPVVPLASIAATPGAVALSFDDGFTNFLDHGLPVLEEFRFPATVFVVCGYCGMDNGWPGQPARVPSHKLMSWDQLRDVSRRGVSLGAHTVSHPDLRGLRPGEVRYELRQSRLQIEQETGAKAPALAYPYGYSDAGIREIAAQEFALACGAGLRFLGDGEDPFNLPRLDMFYLRGPSWLEDLFSRRTARWLGVRRRLRNFRARWLE